MFLEHFARDALVVLATDCEDNATHPQSFRIALKGKERLSFGIALAQADAADPVIPNHAAPESIVEVHDQTFSAVPDVCCQIELTLCAYSTICSGAHGIFAC